MLIKLDFAKKQLGNLLTYLGACFNRLILSTEKVGLYFFSISFK